ncbi:tetratricopeptide repeat protein [Streptomyces sp. NBC_00481]|uniref:tetratricopeptide repeat protein n=1 Tax=unclassified Streptomyces TaxID=2593676 RepID=UPI002DDA1562|nr:MULTISPECIES: tetratricopeptide repeat protein [unclassified Streptomyces]WRY97290.1 tetratricopeptide repeat protein [Streptomyces sp. NBC_00481]
MKRRPVNLADVYYALGDLGRATPLYEATLTQYEQVLGDTPPQHPEQPQQPRHRP